MPGGGGGNAGRGSVCVCVCVWLGDKRLVNDRLAEQVIATKPPTGLKKWWLDFQGYKFMRGASPY